MEVWGLPRWIMLGRLTIKDDDFMIADCACEYLTYPHRVIFRAKQSIEEVKIMMGNHRYNGQNTNQKCSHSLMT